METQVYRAKKIITLNAAQPMATHVAVRDGKILAVGDAQACRAWGDFPVDERFAEHIILPGFVEGHCHLLAGGMWRYTYVGFQARVGPDGRHWSGASNMEEVVARLQEAERALPPGRDALIAWGLDPLFFGDQRPTASDLDRISSERPVAILHSNFHVMTVNSVALDMVGFDADTEVEGVSKGVDGAPDGELQETAAMFPLMRRLKMDFSDLSNDTKSLWDFAATCQRVGVTTAADLINDLHDEDVARFQQITESENYPIRLCSLLNGLAGTPDEIAARALSLAEKSHEKLRLGAVKLMTDGSIQAFTARLRWPGYFNGADNGIWNIAPEQLKAMVDCLNQAHVPMHIHANGDEAIEVTLDAIEAALKTHFNPEHRTTIQHCQMADAAQFERMAKLGACANLFSNHLYYFGDIHREVTVGPQRAEHMNAARTALSLGVKLAVHSDAPVTPMGPLHCAWAAVVRETAKGQSMGDAQRLCVAEALHAVTLGPAYTLNMESEVGSIEVGKWADFAILEADPFEVAPEALKDISIWGTVLAGKAFPL